MRPGRRAVLAALGGTLVSGCSNLAFLAANVPASFGSYRRRVDVAYGGERHQRLDVYTPETASGSMPMMVFWYGGRWTHGDKAEYKFVGAALAALGYVAVLPNYRHYPQVKMQGFMLDAAQAAAFAYRRAADFGADPRRVYLMGHSAGAHIAALATLDQRYFRMLGDVPPIAGFIGLSGPYDFLPLTDPDLQDIFGPPELYFESQPINFARPGAPPALLVQGLKDTSVAPKNSVNLANALRAQGVTVTLKLYPSASHADTVAALSLPARHRETTLEDIASFVDKSPEVRS